MPSLDDLVSQLTRPPAPPSPPPQQPSGTVVLYRDADWRSESMTFKTSELRPGVRQSIVGTSMNDNATYVAYNLPVGTVMTLMDNVVPLDGHPVWDLRNCGQCVDLVGTGKTEGVDLVACNVNDCISSFFWRTVDLNLGAIELFDDVNFSGNRNTLFLSEWPSGEVNSIGQWWLNDRVSAVRWKMLNDRQTASLFNNADGSGTSYENIKGWGETKEIANLPSVGFNDVMSSFRWDGVVPVKEVIKPFTMNLKLDPATATTLSAEETGTNDAPTPLPVTVSLKNSDAQTVTVTSTDTHVAGVKVTSTLSWKAGDGEEEVGGSLSIALSYTYTHTSTVTKSDTKAVELSVSEIATAPPYSTYICKLTVQIGQVPPTTYETTADRWYDQPVTGGVADPANNNWYKRTEPVKGTISGGLHAKTIVDTKSKPLPGHLAA